MTNPAGQDLTLYWRDTALTGTSGNVTRALKRLPAFSPFEMDTAEASYIGPMDVFAEQGDPGVKAMTVTLWMSHKVSGVASALAAERELMDEMRAWHELLLPLSGTGTLTIHRHNAAGADVETDVLYARVLRVSRYGGDVVAGGEMVEPTRAYLETETVFYCPLPYFYAATADTSQVTADSPAGAQTLTNDGALPCGLRVEVAAGGISGSPTSITVANATNGYSFVWSKGSAFAAGDYIDWFYTDPRAVTMTAGTTITGATGDDYMELSSGGNAITALRSAGTGAAVLTCSWKRRDLSL